MPRTRVLVRHLLPLKQASLDVDVSAASFPTAASRGKRERNENHRKLSPLRFPSSEMKWKFCAEKSLLWNDQAQYKNRRVHTTDRASCRKSGKRSQTKQKLQRTREIKAEKKKNIFMKFRFEKNRIFFFYLFAKRRWSWFCFQLCSERWICQTPNRRTKELKWWIICVCWTACKSQRKKRLKKMREMLELRSDRKSIAEGF